MKRTSVAIARGLAHQLWGKVDLQRRGSSGVWWFSCSGHGGYIVDGNIFDLSKIPKVEQFKRKRVYRESSRHPFYYESEDHFYAFEEDCDWAVLELYYEEIARAAFQNNDGYTSFKEYQKMVRENMQRWNPEHLLPLLGEYDSV